MDHSYKSILVLCNPNVDIIADVVEDHEHAVTLDNVAVLQWMGAHVQVIPFQAARDLHIQAMPRKNIAFMCEPDPQLAEIHDKEIAAFRENPKVFVSKSDHMKKLQERSHIAQYPATFDNVLKK